MCVDRAKRVRVRQRDLWPWIWKPTAVALVLLAVVWSGLPERAVAETVVLRQQTLVLRSGIVLDFQTDQQRGFRDTYTSRISILAVEHGRQEEVARVKFRWRMFRAKQHANYDVTGVITTTGIPKGRAFNAWWRQGENTVTSDTHAWLSREACEEIRRVGSTRFVLDRNMRRDPAMVLTREANISFGVQWNGKEVSLPAMRLRSERGDRIVVLSDCRNPLVLDISLPNLYTHTLRKIQTPQEGGWVERRY